MERTRRRGALVSAGVVLACATALAVSAQAPRVPLLQRGPELERLDFLVGRWTGELTRHLPGGATLELRPELDASWGVGGVWLESRDLTELPDGTRIHNRTRLTWDAEAGAYTGAWQDNVFPGLVGFGGRWLDERRLELDTGDFTLFGRPHRVVFVYERVSDDEFEIEMRQAWDGAEARTVAEGRFRRSSEAGEQSAEKHSEGEFGSLNPEAPPETAQFAFAIGEWSCTTSGMRPDGTLTDGPPARWIFHYILDGWAIQDDWVSTAPDGAKTRGTNIRSFNPRTRKWDNRWLASGSLEWKYFESEQVGETMVMTGGRGKDGQGREFVDRNTFHDITDESWSWQKDRSFDGGESWIEGVFRIEAERIR